jgi:hypothetical protein
MMSAWDVSADGSVTAFFDTSDVAITRASIQFVHSADGRHFTKPRTLPLPGGAVVASPTVVRHGSSSHLYYASSASLRARPSVSRLRTADVLFGVAEPVAPIAGVDTALSWPSFAPLASGETVVAFRDGRSVPHFAASADGKSFGDPRPIGEPGAMAAVTEIGGGTLVYTYQHPTATEPMVSYARLSHDRGATWSAPVRVASSPNVHDTSVLARADGGGDLYYIYPPDAHGFSLYRRSITAAGELGPEQRLTVSELGEPSKPRAARLPDGRVLVAFADIAARSPDLQPAVQQIVIAELAGDAPR